MKIYQKLLLGFLIISSLMIIICGIAITSSEKVKHDLHQAISSSAKEVNAASEMVFFLLQTQLKAKTLTSTKYRMVFEPDEEEESKLLMEKSCQSIEKSLIQFDKFLVLSNEVTQFGLLTTEGEEEGGGEEGEEEGRREKREN